MIDINQKAVVLREASATGFIKLKTETMRVIRRREVRKGDVIEVSRVAGIIGAKLTSQNIPHCHLIPIESVAPEVKLERSGIEVRCSVKAHYKTGVEMEALSCVNAMLLNIWDMVKYLEKNEKGQYDTTEISGVKVVEKRKGDNGPQARTRKKV